MTDRPTILPPDYFAADDDVLTDLYRQNASATALAKVYGGLLEVAEVHGTQAAAGIDRKSLAALHRIQATTYRLIEVMEAVRSKRDVPRGAPVTSPELSLDNPLQSSVTHLNAKPQEVSEGRQDNPFPNPLDTDGFDAFKLFGDDK